MEYEIWKPLIYNGQDLSNRIEVSNLGRLRNINNKYIYKLCKNQQGYLGVTISLSKKHKILIKVHRAVAFMFVDNPNNKEQVNHIDGNKTNNKSNNLEWVTCQENLIHAVKHGLKTSGEKCKWSKLSNEDVKQIRLFVKNHIYTMKELSKIFNVSYSTIRDVISYRTYKDVII